MRFIKRTKILINIFCSLGLFDLAVAETYIVKPGDVLTKILLVKKLKPIYGKSGTLGKVIQLNNELKGTEGNVIYPGMSLNLDINNTNQINNTELESKEEIAQSPFLPAYEKVADVNLLPAQEQKREVANDTALSRSDLSLLGLSEFSRVKSTDSTSGGGATFLSDASRGFKFSWGQNWSESLRSSLSFQSINVKIQDSSSAAKTLINKSHTLTQYQFGADYRYSPELKLINSINYGESLVSRSINSTTISLEKFLAPTISTGIDYKLYQVDELALRGLISLRAVLPSKQESYDSKLSLGKKLGIGLSDKLGAFKIEGEFYYQNTNLKMNSATYDQTGIGIMIGIKKGFGAFD